MMSSEPIDEITEPSPEVIVDCNLVSRLIENQFFEYSKLDISLLGEGWDNWSFKLGDDLVVRLPKHKQAVSLLENEKLHLPKFSSLLPIPTPAFSHAGQPTKDYPWPWLITPFFDGKNADQNIPHPSEAIRFADFLRRLHQFDDGTAPRNPNRDIPLSIRDAPTRKAWRAWDAQKESIPQRLVDLWEEACALARPPKGYWLHGDLHYGNVLVQEGRFSAILDWGEICAGDPASDLMAFWLMFPDPRARVSGLSAYCADESMILRAMGWALFYASFFVSTGLNSNPRHLAVGKATMQRLLEDYS